MKKSYKLITAFIVLLSLVTLKVGAQISGVVTINASLPVSSTNYTSFTQLSTTLNAVGISGPLTVNVSNATYTDQLVLNQITGMSSTNTITINGNGSILTFNSGSNNPWTVLLNGTDYLYMNNMNVQGQNSTYAFVVMLSNSANYNVFTACTFSAPSNGTSSYQCPFSISSQTAYLSTGSDAGNFNTVSTCTLANGYYGYYQGGLTNAPYTHDNSIMGCYITDFYYYAIYGYYSKNLTVKNSKIDRFTRTTQSSYTYLIYGMYAQGFDFENNIIENLYNATQTNTGYLYGFYYIGYFNPVGQGVNPCKIINNVVRNINFNGYIYMFMYFYYSDLQVYHNTFSFDQTASTGSGSTYVFYYYYGGNGMYPDIRNNNITVTRGGTGTKCVFYQGTTSANGTIEDYNNVYVNGAGGNNYVGYTSSFYSTLSAWQTGAGFDMNSQSMDPQYVSLTTPDLHPTNSSLNNKGTPLGVPVDILYATRNQTTPDIGAYEFLNPNCSGTPPANSVTASAYTVCAGDNVALGVGSAPGDVGLQYQWLASTTSAVGPWTVVPGATSVLYNTPPVNTTMYYGVAITCTNAVGSTTAAAQISVQGVVTSTVPYFESFEGITRANKLPNCSWYSPNIATGTALTYTASNTLGRIPRTGTKFASFYYSPAGVNYFYTNGIQLNAGITYSASVWYETEYYGYNNWTDLSILYGTTQTSVGLVSIASTNGPAVSNIYKKLSNTFTVPTSGIYYVAIRATATSGSASYLSWDDLSITIPCSANAPTMALTSNSTTICNGDNLVLSASGADTYTWSNGANTSSINDNPANNMTYMVVGSSSLSGCTTTLTQAITVNPAPTVFVYASNSKVCSGTSVNLTAIGSATSYVWSNNMNGANITITPTVSGTNNYTVVGTNSYGCAGMAVETLTVLSNPSINVSSSQPNVMCTGETQVLTASGSAVSYQWVASSNGAIFQGNPLNISPMVATVYTVTGTDANGCSNKTTITQNVSDCTGIKVNNLGNVSIYPNPTSGEITIALNNTAEKTISVVDVTGRLISSSTNSLDAVKVDLSNLANGIYYVKIQTASSMQVVKVVKN